MSAPRRIPDSIHVSQTQASNPETSAFVAANAGSGKTHVLVQRVIRLLLSGTPPERILCITFTKAAAANMAQRVFETLGKWIALDDTKLDDALRATGVTAAGETMRTRARELFARALETPGGLKVQTIHALCTRLLQQFPFEANVVARFTVLDDRDRDALMESAVLAVLQQAVSDPASDSGRALAATRAHAADTTFRDVLNAALTNRNKSGLASNSDLHNAITALRRTLGVDAGATTDALTQAMLDSPHLACSEWPAVAATLETGGDSDRKQAARLRAADAAQGPERLAHYLDVFFTQGSKDNPVGPRKRMMNKELAGQHSELAARMDAEAKRLAPLFEQRKALVICERTEALLTLAIKVEQHYSAAKHRRGALDYDDLIDRSLALLRNTASAWVHYKLDRGIDHVLIDEAQDTSPQQWEIIQELVFEFTSGAGAREGTKRTLFAVGDDKQSIYSFQGAVTKEFDERRRIFQRQFAQALLEWKNVTLTYSFRSGASILKPLEYVFRDPSIHQSITRDADGMPPHLALDDAPPGEIEMWDLEQRPARNEVEGWRAPFDATPQTSPQVVLARRIARRIRALLDGTTQTGRRGERRPLEPRDILILVRKRGALFESIIQALKKVGIPVAGADRLKLTEHIAVVDLMALADALLSPHDELALATVLKSPLFGLNDDHLMRLAIGRTGTLRQALEQHARDGAPFDAAWQRWQSAERHALTDSPFAFYAWVLGGDGGRARMLCRLRAEANDALDEFLELALHYEGRHAASLQGFMHWLRAADIEIKRDLEIARDEVRVMTVHGAKGLEAPVVFLADTTSSPGGNPRNPLIAMPVTAADNSTLSVWASSKADDPEPVAAARQNMAREAEDEYRRLLYVAMTRAMERLVVCGCMPGNVNELKPGWWYTLVRDGLAAGVAAEALVEESVTLADAGARIFRAANEAPPDDVRRESGEPPSPVAEPQWLRQDASSEVRAADWLRPSAIDDDDVAAPRRDLSAAARQLAQRRGTLVHRLLQSLPDIAAEQRPLATERFLARNAADWPAPERTALTERVLALIADARFAAVFAPGSRAEVPVIGHIPRSASSPLAITGQIDRLAITATDVLIVDFKTGHAPAGQPEAVPPAYRRQMALYRALLAALYPERNVRAALLWTETPEIMELSSATLDAELTRIRAG